MTYTYITLVLTLGSNCSLTSHIMKLKNVNCSQCHEAVKLLGHKETQSFFLEVEMTLTICLMTLGSLVFLREHGLR